MSSDWLGSGTDTVNMTVGDDLLRMERLSELFDDITFGHLERLGVGPGLHCLEVGAGSGSVARWMSDAVGPAGRVVATDIDTRYLHPERPASFEIREHDIARDPLEREAFDVVHARLVLMNIPERDAALTSMIDALVPGGWLMIEEFDTRSESGEMLATDQVLQQLLINRGIQPDLGSALPNHFIDLGLTSVGARGQAVQWAGGSAYASLLMASFRQLRQELVDSGRISEEQIDADLSKLRDSRTLRPSPILWSIWGCKPGPQVR
jgi:SAM-dependent methyltransferase